MTYDLQLKDFHSKGELYQSLGGLFESVFVKAYENKLTEEDLDLFEVHLNKNLEASLILTEVVQEEVEKSSQKLGMGSLDHKIKMVKENPIKATLGQVYVAGRTGSAGYFYFKTGGTLMTRLAFGGSLGGIAGSISGVLVDIADEKLNKGRLGDWIVRTWHRVPSEKKRLRAVSWAIAGRVLNEYREVHFKEELERLRGKN